MGIEHPVNMWEYTIATGLVSLFYYFYGSMLTDGRVCVFWQGPFWACAALHNLSRSKRCVNIFPTGGGGRSTEAGQEAITKEG